MTEMNPITVEKTVLALSTEIDEVAEQYREALQAFLTAERAHDLAFAKAYMAHSGPAHEKKFAAEIATQQERVDRDVAEVAYKFIDRKGRAVDKKLDAYRTVGTFVRQAYQNAGRGEW